jgi:FtsP/CotA-like multicopper oxidase with cupredoxin domain
MNDPNPHHPHDAQHPHHPHDAQHSHHAHATHRSHGAGMHHAPAADAADAYRRAYASARPDPGREVVTVELEAREADWTVAPGTIVPAWTYNGQVPGPVLRARVGDVLEVRLVNRLPQPTSIHWHGLRLPAAMDGTDMVQHAVAPGETFTYRFRLPDAGTFWYHPHTDETVQLERGLYGALIVTGDDEPVLDGERVLVLDDLKLDRRGRLAPFGGLVQRHDGREGNTRLVNGVREPVLDMAAGQTERWRIVNASSARYVRLSLGGAAFTLLGTDGGLLAAPQTATEVLLAPSERVELAVGPFPEGASLPIRSLRYWRTTFVRRGDETFATLRVGPVRPSVAVVASSLRSIEPLASPDTPPTRTVDFGLRYSLRRGMDFVVNGEAHHRDAPVKVGELQVWDVVNSTLMDHPFHLHGFSFQVLSVNGKPGEALAWKDVVNLPRKSTTRIAWIPDDRPGSWMYHCHILEHHAAGMMGHFDVVR